MRNGTSAATRARRAKKIIAASIERHVSAAFNESIVVVAREHPKGWAFPYWFAEHLLDYAQKYPKRRRRKR